MARDWIGFPYIDLKARVRADHPQRPIRAIVNTALDRLSADLNQVVVSAQYGAKPRIASPVYIASLARDFGGVLRPGASVSATYAFAVPPQFTRHLVATVDFDGLHAPARFGSVAQ